MNFQFLNIDFFIFLKLFPSSAAIHAKKRGIFTTTGANLTTFYFLKISIK